MAEMATFIGGAHAAEAGKWKSLHATVVASFNSQRSAVERFDPSPTEDSRGFTALQSLAVLAAVLVVASVWTHPVAQVGPIGSQLKYLARPRDQRRPERT